MTQKNKGCVLKEVQCQKKSFRKYLSVASFHGYTFIRSVENKIDRSSRFKVFIFFTSI